MTGLLNPKSSGKKKIIGHIFRMMILVVSYLGHEEFVLSGVAVLVFFSKNQFSVSEVLSYQIEEPQTKQQWLVHLYRRRR